MSTSVTPFQKFVALISFDQAYHQIKHQLQLLETELKQLQQLTNQTEQELAVAHDIVKTAQKAVATTELANQELDTTEQTKKQLLETLTDKKAYTALKKELGYLREQQHTNELVLVQAWTKLETAKQNFEKQKELFNQKLSELQAQISAKQAQQAELNQQLANYEQERRSKEAGVPTEWLTKYATMRTRVQNPVVPVTHGTCTACFYDVTQQDINALKNNRLVECRGCFRFLYLT